MPSLSDAAEAAGLTPCRHARISGGIAFSSGQGWSRAGGRLSSCMHAEDVNVAHLRIMVPPRRCKRVNPLKSRSLGVWGVWGRGG